MMIFKIISRICKGAELEAPVGNRKGLITKWKKTRSIQIRMMKSSTITMLKLMHLEAEKTMMGLTELVGSLKMKSTTTTSMMTRIATVGVSIGKPTTWRTCSQA